MPNRNFLKRWLIRIGWGVTGVLMAGLYLYYLQAQSLPDLQFWHQQDLAESVVPELEDLDQLSLADYLQHEERIFAQLDKTIEEIDADLPGWHRYSAAAHAIYRQAWPESNLSQLQTPDNKRGAALLVHGLSDSTHSMRGLANTLYREGYQTLNLRMPGHGTLPGALQNVSWKQFRAAYHLGVNDISEDLKPGQPLILAGYSNGAALAVDYTITALASGGELAVPQLLVLLSPAIRVSPLAAYANIQRWISELPGMEKLGWTDVVAEFDPFKYNSFPVHAGGEIYQLTSRMEQNLLKLTSEELAQFPPVLAFQSVLDATIPGDSVVTGFLDHLADTPAELVLFDINRNSSMLPLLANRGEQWLKTLSGRRKLDFDLSIVGNANENSERVVVRTRQRGESDWKEQTTNMQWPPGVYSLSHVALPFASDDQIYGQSGSDNLVRLGDLWFRGERGGLAIPLPLLARQRFNPFFPYLEKRVLAAAEAVTNDR